MNAVEIYEKASRDVEHGKITLGEFEERIKPLYDVEPIRHAEWQLRHRRDKDFYKNVYQCSECRFLVIGISGVAYAYCPNCGAKMEGKER